MGYTSVRKCIHIEIERRYNLIHEKEGTGEPVSIICKRYGISRKTYYKWNNRYNQKGIDGLSDLALEDIPNIDDGKLRYGNSTVVDL